MTRREWFSKLKERALRWAPWLGLFGLQAHEYARPALTGWQGWITWYGQTIGFIRVDGTIHWWGL